MSTRRVYPLRPASGTPGRTTYAQVQMRGLPQPESQPAAAFTPDIAGPALLPEWRYMMGGARYEVYNTYNWTGKPYEVLDELPFNEEFWEKWKYYDEERGAYVYHTGPGDYTLYVQVMENSIKHGSGYELPAAVYSADGRMTRCWVNLGEFSRPLRFRAVLLGRAMRDVHWTAELDTPPRPASWSTDDLGTLWPDGVEVEDEGHSLLIRVHKGKKGGKEPYSATLRLEAFCAGKSAGTLEMRLGWNQGKLWPAEQQERYDFAGWDGWKPSDDQESV